MKQNSRHLFITVFAIVAILVELSKTESSTKLRDVLKNSTYSYNNSYSNNSEDDDMFRTEARKMIKQCDAESSENYNTKQSGEASSGYNRNYNYDGYGNQSGVRNRGGKNKGYNTYDYNNDNRNRYNNRNQFGSYGYNSNGYDNSQVVSNKSCSDNKTPSYGGDYGQDRGTYNSYRGGGSDTYYGGTEYDRNYFKSRMKRSNRRNNENQCISQCVFGYMNLMDENQTPSETLFIKWLQDRMANNDLKRIKALREVRRCFARLSTSDMEDGCEFSKELAKCMNLDLD